MQYVRVYVPIFDGEDRDGQHAIDAWPFLRCQHLITHRRGIALLSFALSHLSKEPAIHMQSQPWRHPMWHEAMFVLREANHLSELRWREQHSTAQHSPRKHT